MKLFLFFLFFSIQCKSQLTKNTPCEGKKVLFDTSIATSITVYIKDKKDQGAIEKDFFQTPFQLSISDDSAQIISYYICWNNLVTGISYMRSNKGYTIKPDSDLEDEKYRNESSLKQLRSGDKLAFDMMLIKKGDNCYIVSPLIIAVK